MKWHPITEEPPENPERDYGDWVESVDVLVTDGVGGYWIARQRFPRGEYSPDGWVLQGRDAYSIDWTLTHWGELPCG
jgi:hypothetical protein